jgi:uncharacterized damage-inducible protein DinB
MNKTEIANFYQRDIQRVIDEINLFKDESNIWKTCGSLNNSSGNLVLHLLGGLNYLIGTNLGKTNYVRNRDSEFTTKSVGRKQLVEHLNELKSMIDKTLRSLTEEELENSFPIFFDKENAKISYVLAQLLLHLNYHLGQINYLRRTLE